MKALKGEIQWIHLFSFSVVPVVRRKDEARW